MTKNPKDDPKIADVLVNWKEGNIHRRCTRKPEEEGYFASSAEDGYPMADVPDAVWLMDWLLRRSGLTVPMIPEDWPEYMRFARRQVWHSNDHIPPGTLFLAIYVNRYYGGSGQLPQLELADDERLLEDFREDSEAGACAERLMKERNVRRIWLHVKDRRFKHVQLPRYDSPMARLALKPQYVRDRRLHISFLPFDLIK